MASVKIKTKYERPSCVVRIHPEAMKVLDKLEKITGQPRSYLASQLIVQGSQFIEFCPEECENCEFRVRCNKISYAEKEAAQ